MEETTPLLPRDTRSDLPLPPLPPPYPAAVNDDAKKLVPGVSAPSVEHDSKGAADADEAAVDDDQESGLSLPSADSDSKKGAGATTNATDVVSAGKKESWFHGRGWFQGRGATGSIEASSSGVQQEEDHVLDIPHSSRSLPTAAPGGGLEAEARKGFPSRLLAALIGRKRDEEAEALLQRTQVFAGDCRGHVTLTKPVADLTEALRKFTTARNAATAASLAMDAAALEKIAGSDKLEQGNALVAKQISKEAAALATSRTGATCSMKSPEILFYIAIPSSLGLLPYLNTTIPKNLQTVVSCLFGVVFSAATAGAILVARGREHIDTEVANIVGAICFTSFSCLVIVFVSFALAGGNLVLMGLLVVILAAMHTCVWARK